MTQKCYVIEIAFPQSRVESKPELVEEAKKLNDEFAQGVLNFGDAEDLDEEEAIKIMILYIPSSAYPRDQILTNIARWRRTFLEKYPAPEDRPSTRFFELTRANIPWTPPAVAEGRISLGEASNLLDQLEDEASSGSGTQAIERLRELLIPKVVTI